MRIGELAKISGLAPSRIRFYEASGLISSVERKANGYRDYAPDTEWVLEIITGAQAAGFSLEEIRQLMLVIKGIEGKPEGMACGDNAQMLINRLREEGVGKASGGRKATSSTKNKARQASGA